jgi:hypothetical protein
MAWEHTLGTDIMMTCTHRAHPAMKWYVPRSAAMQDRAKTVPARTVQAGEYQYKQLAPCRPWAAAVGPGIVLRHAGCCFTFLAIQPCPRHAKAWRG